MQTLNHKVDTCIYQTWQYFSSAKMFHKIRNKLN